MIHRRACASTTVLLLSLIALTISTTRADFEDDDVRETYSLRRGDKTVCPSRLEFEDDDLTLSASSIEADDIRCEGGTLTLTENPTDSAATRYLVANQNDVGDFLAGRFSDDVNCNSIKLLKGTQLIFVKPDDDLTLVWRDVFGGSSPLGEEEDSSDLNEDDKYLIYGARCLYSETRLSDRVCLPASARVRLSDNSWRRVPSLRIGDEVHVGQGRLSQMMGWTHRDESVHAMFVKAHTLRHGNLTATEGHFVYADGRMIMMKDVQVGMTLTHESGALVEVVKVSLFETRGVWNPHTLHGDLVVDGFVTSCYTHVVQPSTAHALLAPVRAVMRSLFSAEASTSY